MNYAHVKSDNEIYWSPVPKPETGPTSHWLMTMTQ